MQTKGEEKNDELEGEENREKKKKAGRGGEKTRKPRTAKSYVLSDSLSRFSFAPEEEIEMR